MNPTEKYYDAVERILREIKEKEMASIEKAAGLISERIVNNEIIWAFGTGGHSIMGAMELFTRAGGLAAINPIFPPGMTNTESHPNTESLVGYAQKILDYYRVKKGDLLIEINVNGINAVTIDTALECKKREVYLIAITSREFSRGAAPGIPNRHPSNKNLFELADLVVDAHVPPGDAVVDIDGFDLKVKKVCMQYLEKRSSMILIGSFVVVPQGGQMCGEKSKNNHTYIIICKRNAKNLKVYQ